MRGKIRLPDHRRIVEDIGGLGIHQIVEHSEAGTDHRGPLVILRDPIRDAHARYYAGFVRVTAAELVGADAPAAYASFDQEIDNIRSGLAWLVHTGDAEAALRLAAPMRLLWAPE